MYEIRAVVLKRKNTDADVYRYIHDAELRFPIYSYHIINH